ncbi:MAG: hypothetical protein ABIH23_20495 [bacterium]
MTSETDNFLQKYGGIIIQSIMLILVLLGLWLVMDRRVTASEININAHRERIARAEVLIDRLDQNQRVLQQITAEQKVMLQWLIPKQ